MLFQKKNTFCLFDIGSYKISCSIVVEENGNLTIIYRNSKPTQGYNKGLVTSKQQIKNLVLSLIVEAEKATKLDIEKVIVSVSALKIATKTAIVEDSLMGRQVLKEDIKKLINKSLTSIDAASQEIIHFFPVRFCLDDITVVKNPERLFAEKLECEVNLLFTDRDLLFSLATIFADCHLKVDDFVLDVFASAIAVCTEEELNKLLIIDFGHEVTSFAYFENKALLECGAIDIGGRQITQDIKNIFSVTYAEAEKAKNHYCSNFHENEAEYGEVDFKTLDKVVSSRIEEIVEEVQKRCVRKPRHIKLVGGGVKLPRIEEITETVFKVSSESGHIVEKHDGAKLLKDNDYVLAGMLNYISKGTSERPKHNIFSGPLKKVLSWLKENF